MPISCKFPSLATCQSRFLCAHKKTSLTQHPVVGFALQARDVQKLPQVPGLETWIFFSTVSKQGPRLVAKEDDGHILPWVYTGENTTLLIMQPVLFLCWQHRPREYLCAYVLIWSTLISFCSLFCDFSCSLRDVLWLCVICKMPYWYSLAFCTTLLMQKSGSEVDPSMSAMIPKQTRVVSYFWHTSLWRKHRSVRGGEKSHNVKLKLILKLIKSHNILWLTFCVNTSILVCEIFCWTV